MPSAEGPLPEGYQAQLGTKEYAAPEQYNPLGRVSARRDVYGFAAVLYVALTEKPIGDESYRARPLRQIISDPKGWSQFFRRQCKRILSISVRIF